jgi:hypothetical protein
MEQSPLDEATFAHPLKKFQKILFLLSIELFENDVIKKMRLTKRHGRNKE